MTALLPLRELQEQARAQRCELVTFEFLDDVRRGAVENSKLREELRKVRALELVVENHTWRGWLVRRWIRRTETALAMFRGERV